MTAAGPAVAHREVVCPFCALACDDLSVAAEGPRLLVKERGCARSEQAFALPVGDPHPLVGGLPADLDRALARAAELLASSRLPLFAGLGTDTGGMRAVMRLAERTGGIVDHAGAAGLFPNLLAMQSGGGITTTLAEVRNRMDLLLLVGTDAARLMPRFFERCVWPKDALLRDALERRKVVYLGEPRRFEEGDVEIVECRAERLGEAIGALRVLTAGGRLRAEQVAGIGIDRLRDLAKRLEGARYAVIAWAAGELPAPHADLLVGGIAALIRTLSAATRCVGLPLAGHDNTIGANQICSWQSGLPLRTSFASGAPDYDPHCHASARLLERGDADLLVWITSFSALPAPATDRPTIVLGRAGAAFEPAPEVFVPVGTPGLDHAGSLYRTDGVVAMPLRKLRETGLSSVAEILSRIERHLPG
ncbi:MAG: formylmethanofuran dehydrogenase subunit B [Geminicoccaceae bacterium]